MKRFSLIAHTADIGIVAYGANLAEVYGNAAYGLFSIITDLRRVRATELRTAEVSGDDPEALLFEWLNHLIYLFDVENLLLKRFDIVELDDNHLKAVCRGEKYDPLRHRLKIGVKSATYHMLKVDKENNQAQVIFDI